VTEELRRQCIKRLLRVATSEVDVLLLTTGDIPDSVRDMATRLNVGTVSAPQNISSTADLVVKSVLGPERELF
jgi:hypothetical protein